MIVALPGVASVLCVLCMLVVWVCVCVVNVQLLGRCRKGSVRAAAKVGRCICGWSGYGGCSLACGGGSKHDPTPTLYDSDGGVSCRYLFFLLLYLSSAVVTSSEGLCSKILI